MKTLTLLLLLSLLTLAAPAQTITIPPHVQGVTLASLTWTTLAATDTTLWSWYVPVTVYFRQAQVRAVTVEDTASFVLEGGTNFATTYATVAVNAAGVSYANATNGRQKIMGGTTIRLRAVLQDTIDKVSANLLFTREP